MALLRKVFTRAQHRPYTTRVKKRVSERVFPRVMHIIKFETLYETLGEREKSRQVSRRESRCAEQCRLRWIWWLEDRYWKGFSNHKNILWILWWIRKMQRTRRKVDSMYRMASVGLPRVLRCWNSHICFLILQVKISFEHFVWFFSRCPFLYPSPFLFHF